MKKNNLILLILVFVVAFVVRFYQLGEIPRGLAQDETSIGYNAYSILTTGRDEYGKSYPVNFKAFGEYKLPLYIYADVPSVAVFGTTPIGVRLPSALFGFLTVVVFFFFVRELTKKEDLSIISTLFLALNPWHIHFSRAAFEVVPALFFIVLGSYLFLKFAAKKNYILLSIAGVSFVLSMYSYNICRVFTPLLVLILLYEYRKQVSLKNASLYLAALPAILVSLPYVATVLRPEGFASTEGTILWSSAPVQAKLIETRSDILLSSPILSKLIFNKLFLTLLEYAKNIVSYFSVSFLFITGSDHGNHGIGNVGMFYLFEIITFASGLIANIRKKESWFSLILFWIAAEILVAAFTREAPHGARGFFLIPPLVIISSFGALHLFGYFKSLKMNIRYGLIAASAVLILFNLIYYFSSYYFRFPLLYGEAWRSEDSSVVAYINENQNKYDKILIDEDSSFVYTSYLYYSRYSPLEFKQTVKRGPDDSEGFSKVHSFGKFEFGKIKSRLNSGAKTLIVTTPKNVPANTPILATFYYPERPIAIADGQTILQYPTKDIAYVVVEQK